MTSTFYVQILLAALTDGSWQGYVVFALLGFMPFVCVLAVLMLVSERWRYFIG